jgi:hypothetical protein
VNHDWTAQANGAQSGVVNASARDNGFANKGAMEIPMSTTSKGVRVALSVLSMAICTAHLQAGEPVYPQKVSDNHRYFVDQKGDPVFWLGTTQWQLFREYTLEEARLIITKTKSHGFAFAQVMLLGVGDGTKANIEGEKPYLNSDPLTPNEAYFKHVDAVVQIARAISSPAKRRAPGRSGSRAVTKRSPPSFGP